MRPVLIIVKDGEGELLVHSPSSLDIDVEWLPARVEVVHDGVALGDGLGSILDDNVRVLRNPRVRQSDDERRREEEKKKGGEEEDGFEAAGRRGEQRTRLSQESVFVVEALGVAREGEDLDGC